MKCPHCNNSFSSLSSMNNHIKSAKYCLAKRGVEKKPFKCLRCSKTFTSKRWASSHMSKCGESVVKLKQQNIDLMNQNDRLDNLVDDLRSQVRQLQDKLENIAIKAVERPTTTNNTVNNNTLNLAVFNPTLDDIEQIVAENYNIKHLEGGAIGSAEFTNKNVLSNSTGDPKYTVTDKTRCNGKYKKSKSEIVIDYGMHGLTKLIHPPIKKHARKIYTDPKHVEKALDETSRLSIGYNEVMNLQDPKIHKKFTKEIAKGLIVSTMS